MYGRTRLLVAAAIAITTTGVWVTATSTQVAAIDPVANPSIEESCGVDVTLVLDASGSISSAGAVDDVRDAAQSFLDSLKDTDSTARVTQFATASEELAPPTLVTGAALGPGGVLRDAVSAYYSPKPPQPAAQVWYKYLGGDPTNGRNFRRQSSDQYTNWDQSLKQAGDTPSELVVYITDGQPSAYDLDKPTDPFTTPPARVAWGTDKNQANQVTLDRAIEEANVVKSANTRMLVVGVGKATGSSALQQRLVQISGPQIVKDADLANIDSLNDIDVAIVSDFDDLAAFLRKVVLELCSPSLTITKLAQTPGSAAYSPAPGWSITATPEVPGGGNPPFSWILPDTTPAVSKTLDTNANGVAQFQWEPNPPEEDSRATITEVLQPDYTAGRIANPDYRCELRNEAGDVRVVEGDLASLSFVLDPIGQEIVTCTIWNSFDYAPAIALTKVDAPTVVRGDLTPEAVVTSTFTVTNPGNTPLDGVTVTDDRCTPLSVEVGGSNVGDINQDGRLDPGEAWQFTCTRDIRTGASTDPAGQTITNNAEVTGTDPTGASVMATANAAIVAFNPAIALEKLVDGAKSVTIAAGDSVTYTFQVTNAGNTSLGSVDLVDVSDPPPDVCPSPINRDPDTPGNDDDILDVGDVWNYSCTTSPGEGVGDVATVTATPLNPLDGGQPFVDPNPPVVATSAAEVAVINPAVELAKVATPNVVLLDAAGDPEMVTYTFTATNPGNARLVRPNGTPTTDPGWVKDTQCLLSVTYFSGDTNTDGFFDPGETWVFTCDNLVSAPTLNVAEITAQPVDSTGAPVGGTVRDFATVFVDVLQPGIDVVKTSLRATVLDPNADAESGPDVPRRPAEYVYRVDNTGTAPLDLSVTPPVDDKCAPVTFVSGDTNGDSRLDPTEVWVYSCSTLLTRADANSPR